MSTSTSLDEVASSKTERNRHINWLTTVFWLGVLALLVIAVVMRLYGLGLPFDRDGYDEGVYWQSLLAMSAGHALYSDIFYSQPPFFLLSTFPTFALFGGTLWSARLGIALVSLFGLLGAFLLGKALSGRVGALAAMALVIVNPLYLAQSQTIQAEVSSAAFELLAIGLALYWWKYPTGRRGIVLAILTGVTVALSILCKLLGVSLLVPVGLLMAARLWIGVPSGDRNIQKGRLYAAALAGIAAFIITTAVLLLPFAGDFQAFVSSVITFHTGASAQFIQSANSSLITSALESLLTLAALYGSLAALLRQDWRVLPLLAWFLASAFLLLRQVPLFPHHLVSLVPPLVALAAMGVALPSPEKQPASSSAARLQMTDAAKHSGRSSRCAGAAGGGFQPVAGYYVLSHGPGARRRWTGAIRGARRRRSALCHLAGPAGRHRRPVRRGPGRSRHAPCSRRYLDGAHQFRLSHPDPPRVDCLSTPGT